MGKKYCCRGFESWYKQKGKKGLSIEDEDNSLAPFKIVALAVDRSDQVGLLGQLRESKITYNLRVEMEGAISFCPWCGTKLSSL